ncbi:MAG: 4Fe-4S dicluster domain-containing protein [Acidimicrobiia bacterium]|nr:4Fe-4S dicluster domain-containing protein [Acidimicrobiia bacterium]
MTTTEVSPADGATVDDDVAPTTPLPKASTVLQVLGILSAAGTMGLWWLAQFPGHPHFDVGREIFGNIPPVIEGTFYVTVSVFLWLTFALFAKRAESWQRGKSEDRTGQLGRRLSRLWDGLSMKTLLRDRTAGLMHSMVYFGFVVLFLGTVTLEIDHLMPAGLKFLHGPVYQGYSFVLDLASVVYLGGLLWAVVRRYAGGVWRLRSKTKPEDGWILLTLALIGITGLLTEAARISLVGRPTFEYWSFIGHPLSAMVPADVASGAHQAAWVTHVIAFFAFLVVLPTTKLRHMFTSPANLAMEPRERHKGAMREMPNLMEVEDIDTIGAAVVTDLTWKQLFDTDACTVCGRCTSVCPANITGKPLDPREMVLKMGEVASVAAGVSPPVSFDEGIVIESEELTSRITPEEAFACTTCRACDEICPVGIDIMDRILDVRRNLVLMESDFPSELGKAFVAMENQSNPWGLSQQQRDSWTDELDFEIPRLTEATDEIEFLWFVGCAGSFDDRNTAVSVALARLLNKAGISFAILGQNELCNGDPARRSGNEFVFQQLALQNIETFADLGVKKIITQCAHCFNTLANEYPQFGGDYEVIHHSQLLAQLLEADRIPLTENLEERPITFHDPCYLGRHNDVYMAPREVVSAAAGPVTEMERHGTKGLCCGAGGARFWMEEQTGKKVQTERAEEAIATGAEEIAVGCPFCYVMLDDAVSELGKDEDVRVRDLAMILADRLEDSKG